MDQNISETASSTQIPEPSPVRISPRESTLSGCRAYYEGDEFYCDCGADGAHNCFGDN